jgi:hypothetical protein
MREGRADPKILDVRILAFIFAPSFHHYRVTDLVYRNTASNIEQEVESTTLLSERQLTTQESAASVPDWTFNWDNSKNSEMDAILSRLQPEQWLNPFAMLWVSDISIPNFLALSIWVEWLML